MRMMKRAVGIVAMTYAGLVLMLYLFQSSLVYHPEIGRELRDTPRQAGLDYEDVNLVTADGIALHGWLVPALNPAARCSFFMATRATFPIASIRCRCFTVWAIAR